MSADILWAQLAEIDKVGTESALSKARTVREICETERLSGREFAKQAKERGIESVSTPARVSQLLSWLQIVELARERGVLTAVNTPSERALRPLFRKRIPPHQRLDLLANAASEGVVTASSVRKAVRDAYPPKPRTRIPMSEAKRKTVPHLKALVRTYGFEAVFSGMQRVIADHERDERRKVTDGD